MKKIVLLLFSICFLHAGIVKTTKVSSSDGIGIGKTRQEAVNNAIIEAIGKINGVKISSTKFTSVRSIESSDGSYLTDTYSAQIKKATRGKVDSYTINSVDELNGQYEASVTVKKISIKRSYKTPGYSPHKRRRIAVIPSYSSKLTFDILGKRYYQSKVSNHLTQEVVSAITQTRKFTVLDREAKEAYEDEKSLILQDSPKRELVKLGQVLGTDYLYVLNISNYSLSDEAKVNDITGVAKNGAMLNATIEYRIIVMATRQIKYSNTKNFSFRVDGKNGEQYFLNSLKSIAKNLTDDIMNNIYPVKIARVNKNGVVLTQKLTQGEVYDVFSLGKKLYDNYTKESVGYEESRVGSIEITRVTPKISYGKIISGHAKKGDICRLVSQENQTQRPDVTEEEKPSDVKLKDGGGVVLPFD